MSDTKDDGGPFHSRAPTWVQPQTTTFPGGGVSTAGGLVGGHSGASFRAVAAMHAMAGILADSSASGDVEHVATAAVRYADALIAELKK